MWEYTQIVNSREVKLDLAAKFLRKPRYLAAFCRLITALPLRRIASVELSTVTLAEKADECPVVLARIIDQPQSVSGLSL